MSINLSKAYAEQRDLQNQLQVLLQNNQSPRINQAVNSIDAAGQPVITLSRNGSVAAGQPVIVLRFVPVLNPDLSIFGQPIASGTPSNLQFAYELTSGGKPTPNELDMIATMYQAIPIGNRLQVFQIANTVAVTPAAIDAQIAGGTGPAQEFTALYWPGSGNV